MASEESFLYCSSDEEVFIGKITDVEIAKMASLGIETDNIPDSRRAKNRPVQTQSMSKSQDKQESNCTEVAGFKSQNDSVIEVGSQNDSVVVISDSDDSFLDASSNKAECERVDEARFARAMGGSDLEENGSKKVNMTDSKDEHSSQSGIKITEEYAPDSIKGLDKVSPTKESTDLMKTQAEHTKASENKSRKEGELLWDASLTNVEDAQDDTSKQADCEKLASTNDDVLSISGTSDNVYISNLSPRISVESYVVKNTLRSLESLSTDSFNTTNDGILSVNITSDTIYTTFDKRFETPSASLENLVKSKVSSTGNFSLNAISDSVLNISAGSSISSPVYEDITEPDLHMSVDETEFQSEVGSDGHCVPLTADRGPSCSSYYTACSKVHDDSAPAPAHQASVSFEQYRSASENQVDLEDINDIKNSVKETSFEAVVQNRQNSFSGITNFTVTSDSCEKSQKKFTSKLPVFSSSSLIRPPQLVFKEAASGSKPSKVSKQESTVRLQKATAVGTSMLPKPKSKTPVSKIPTSRTPIKTLTPRAEQLKPLSSKKNGQYDNVISPIRAYINAVPTVLTQRGASVEPVLKSANKTKSSTAGSKPTAEQASRSAGKSVNVSSAKPSTIIKRLHYKDSSKEGQENKDPARDTLPPRAFQHADTVFVKDSEQPIRRLPKIGESFKKMMSPSMKLTVHKGRVNELPAAKGVVVPRIAVQPPTPLKPTKENNCQHDISVRLETTCKQHDL